MRENLLPLDILQFAFFPGLWDVYRDLAEIAHPESWAFVHPSPETNCEDVEVLAHYMGSAYRKNASDYNDAKTQRGKDVCVYVDSKFACFHTGLVTEDMKGIYALFMLQARRNVMQDWIFHSFIQDGSPWLAEMEEAPLPPAYHCPDYAQAFYLDWSVYVPFDKVFRLSGVQALLPPELKGFERFKAALLKEVNRGRRSAELIPDYIAPIAFKDSIAYAMPIYLTGKEEFDFALVLKPMEHLSYVGEVTLMPRDAYHSARLLGPVYAPWLRSLLWQDEHSTQDVASIAL